MCYRRVTISTLSVTYWNPWIWSWLILLRPCPYLGPTHRVFILHIIRSCASSPCAQFFFISFHMPSLHLSIVLPSFRCPLTPNVHVLIRIVTVVGLFMFSMLWVKSVITIHLLEILTNLCRFDLLWWNPYLCQMSTRTSQVAGVDDTDTMMDTPVIKAEEALPLSSSRYERATTPSISSDIYQARDSNFRLRDSVGLQPTIVCLRAKQLSQNHTCLCGRV